MLNLKISPSRYIVKDNLLGNAHNYIRALGAKAFIVAEQFIIETFKKDISNGFGEIEHNYGLFNSQCCDTEIKRLILLARQSNSNVIVGIGGGKALDTAKAVGHHMMMPVVTIPTSCATCACWSALSAIYTSEGVADHYLILDRTPDILLMDTNIIGRAPVRLLVSGIGDTLAKYYESVASTGNKTDDMTTAIALNIARYAYDTIFSLGSQAVKDCKRGRITVAIKRIIECNCVLAGLVGGFGGEKCRAVAAHALNNGFTLLHRTHAFMHGELVAFSNLVQLALENKFSELSKLRYLHKKIALPLRLKDIGLDGVTQQELRKVVKRACSEKETMHNLKFPVDEKMVYNAIEFVDKFGI